MTPPLKLIVTDETGAELDTVWAKRLLERTGLVLQVTGEHDQDVLEGGPPPLTWTVTLLRPGNPPRQIAALECDQGARVRTAKQLLVALDAGLLP